MFVYAYFEQPFQRPNIKPLYYYFGAQNLIIIISIIIVVVHAGDVAVVAYNKTWT